MAATEKAKVQLRTFQMKKAERMNLAETAHCSKRVKMMEKDVYQYGIRVAQRKKDITNQMTDVRRTSGYSAVRLRPIANDPQLKESPYFTTDKSLSEKTLTKWRITECHLERMFRTADIEKRKQRQYEESVIAFLKEVGIISEEAHIFKGGRETTRGVTESNIADQRIIDGYDDEAEERRIKEENHQNLPIWDRFPRLWKAMYVRPSTASGCLKSMADTKEECENAINEYVQRMSAPISKQLRIKGMMSTLPSSQTQVLQISTSEEPDIKPSNTRPRALSAPFSRHSLAGRSDSISQPQAEQATPSSTKPSSAKRRSTLKPKVLSKEEQDDINAIKEIEKELENQGFERLPAWRRQLNNDAPIGLIGNREKVKIHLTTSKSQLRRELENLVEENRKDVDRISREANQKRDQTREAMTKALGTTVSTAEIDAS